MNNKLTIKIICASLLLFNSMQALADDGVCSTASLINPNTIDGGMGGTGVPANGGFGGTGAPANGGLGGTGITAQAGGAGGTGIDPERGGTGGTGAPIEHGGLGGTGAMAENSAILPNDTQGGIAIMGVVTGFASICVNNEEVHYEQATPVYDNGQPTKLGKLAVGKMVMLKATRAANGRLNAKAIGLYDAVNGPVSRMDVGSQSMQVMGQTVRLNQNTMQQAKAIAAGTQVRVSGHRLDNGEIIATRIDAGATTGANTMGVVTNVARDGFTVNGTKVNVSDRKLLDSIKTGNEVRVSGDWNGNALQAKRVDAQPTRQLINRADSAILEGYVRAENNGGKLAGTEIRFAEGNARSKDMEKNSGKLVKIELSRDKRGNWVYDKVEQRKGNLFDKGKFENRDQENGGGDNSGSNDSDSSGSGSGNDNSGSGSSGSNSGSSGSGSSGSGSSGSGSSGSGSSGSGSSGSGSSGSGSSGSGSSGSGSSGRSSGSGSSGASRPSSGGGAVDRIDRSSGSSGRMGGSSGSSGSGSSGRSGSGGSGSGSGKNK
jgi:Domain of unknown function (DUF5666)